MYKVGVVPGKFFPPHRGHLNQIINAATKCERLYVVVSDDEALVRKKCLADSLPYIPIKLRALWLSVELQGFEHITVMYMDETGIPEYPAGCEPWARLLINTVPVKFDVIFGGEPEYADTFTPHFHPQVKYELFDYTRSRYPVSGTEIRHNYLKHWDYILGSARGFFCRRVLLTGTESCGKTTMTNYLAKIFHTSWSEEFGRYYSERFLGGNEDLFGLDDFARICRLQLEQDTDAIRSANKIVFIDSDAVVTQYYCELYLGVQNPAIEHYVNPSRFDAVLMFGPQVPWVADGQRFLGDQKERERLHDRLLQMYIERGFKNKIIEIPHESYTQRLDAAMLIADKLLADERFMSRY